MVLQYGQVSRPSQQQLDWVYNVKKGNLLAQANQALADIGNRMNQDRQGALDLATTNYENQYDTWTNRILPWLEQWQTAKNEFDANVLPYTSQFLNAINTNPNPEPVTLYANGQPITRDSPVMDFKTAVRGKEIANQGDPTRPTAPPTNDYEFMPEYGFDLRQYATGNSDIAPELAWLEKAMYREGKETRMNRPSGGVNADWMRQHKANVLQDQSINAERAALDQALQQQLTDWEAQLQPWQQHYGTYKTNNEDWNELRKATDLDREALLLHTQGLDDFIDSRDPNNWALSFEGSDDWDNVFPSKYQPVADAVKGMNESVDDLFGTTNLSQILARHGFGGPYTVLERPQDYGLGDLPELQWQPPDNPYQAYITKVRRQNLQDLRS